MKLEAGGRIWAKNKFLYPPLIVLPALTTTCHIRQLLGRTMVPMESYKEFTAANKKTRQSLWEEAESWKPPLIELFLGGFSVQNMLNGAAGPRQLMGQWVCTCPAPIHWPPGLQCQPCTALASRWGKVGWRLRGRWRWWGSSAATGQPRPPLKAPSGLLQGIRPSTVGGL